MTPKTGLASGAFTYSAATSASMVLKSVQSVNCGW